MLQSELVETSRIEVSIDFDEWYSRTAEREAGHLSDAEVAPLVATKPGHVPEGLLFFGVVFGQIPCTGTEGVEELHYDELLLRRLLTVDRPRGHAPFDFVQELLVHRSPRSAKLNTESATIM